MCACAYLHFKIRDKRASKIDKKDAKEKVKETWRNRV